MSRSEEEWRPIPGLDGYEASSEGRIRSVDRVVEYADGRRQKHAGRLMTPSPNARSGAAVVCVHAKVLFVGILVAEAFHGPRPDGLSLNYLDGDHMNTHPDNLRWGFQTSRGRCRRGHSISGRNAQRSTGTVLKCAACTEARRYLRTHPDADESAVRARFERKYIEEGTKHGN